MAEPTLLEAFWRDFADGIDPDPPPKRLDLERHLPALHPKQRIALSSKATELMYGGAAGGGKSFFNRYSAIMWCDRVPGLQVYFFRRTFPELWKNHMRGKNSFYELLGPWIKSKQVRVVGKEVRFLYNGSTIHLCHAQYEDDVVAYDGDEIHMLVMDEATTFTEYQYRYLRSRCRLGGLRIPDEWAGMLPRIQCGTNPGGVGHNFFKDSFLPMSRPWAVWQTPAREGGMLRQYIPARLDDNPSIEEGYREKLEGMGDPLLVRSKLDGDWNIIAGGRFDDVAAPLEGEDRPRYLLDPFEIPRSWYIDRTYDHGESQPYAVCWWAESDGTEAVMADGSRRTFPRGSLFLIDEDYGWTGERNKGLRLTAKEIAMRVRERDRQPDLLGRVRPGPADGQIYVESNGNSIAADMRAVGVLWQEADKSPGTRVLGWQKLHSYLKETRKDRPEAPGLWVFERCEQWRETVPTLLRDERRPDDTKDGQEDHLGDATRYRLLGRRRSRGGPRKVALG